MPSYLSQVNVHLVWATHQRAPDIIPAIERDVWASIARVARDLRCGVHAVGGVDDHVHLLVWLHPSCAIATLVRETKVASAMSARRDLDVSLRWQRGYGAFPLEPRDLLSAVGYVAAQRAHHRRHTTRAVLECFGEDAFDDAAGLADASR